ncbi:TetR/AcrR family transcriptional regulator [Mycolicibacterium sp. XJ879]
MTETDTTVEKPQIPEKILVAAARVMGREGFANASLRQIADEAGMTKAGLYYHVASKEVLLFALHERFAGRLSVYSERIAAADLSPTEKLRQLIKHTIETAVVYQSEGTVFLREYTHLTGEMAATVFKQRDRFRSVFEEVIDEGLATGEFRPGNTRLDALAILGACNFTAFWFDPEGAASIDEIAETFADRLVYGMGVRDNDKGGRA